VVSAAESPRAECAEAVLFLVCDRARYMTGTQFVIDAGLLSC
jgi:NAD(P)-dependent dehydrogenase (short-subunit alcohol dehydrogenase family)